MLDYYKQLPRELHGAETYGIHRHKINIIYFTEEAVAAEGGILLSKQMAAVTCGGGSRQGPREPLLETGSSGWGQNCFKDSFLLFLPDTAHPGHSLVLTQ